MRREVIGHGVAGALLLWLAICIAFALAGCGHAPGTPQVVYQEVDKPVAVSCVPADLPAAPVVIVPGELAKLSGPERYRQTAAAYLALYGWSLTAGPVLAGCR